MKRSAILLSLCLYACGEKITLTVVVPQMKLGQREVKLGEQVTGRTARLWEDKGSVFITEGETQPAPPGLARLPLATETMYVLAPFTTTHDDALAEDRGSRRLEIGAKLSVAKDLPGMNAHVLLLVDEGKPKAFLRRADFGSAEPSADDLMRAAKLALSENGLTRVRAFVDAALAKDARHLSARRLDAALLHHFSDSRGWKLWLEVKPEDPPTAHLPQKPAVAEAGQAFAMGEGLSVREKADANAKRLRMIPIGTPVEVLGVSGDWAEVNVAKEGAKLAVLAVDALVDDVAPWSAESKAASAAPTHGFMAAKFLSTAKPDAAELKTLGLAAKTPQDALVPLRRAMKLQPDQAVQTALVAAAMATDQFIFALEAVSTRLPDPNVALPKITIAIERVLGCRGDRDKARQHLESGAGAIVAPAWDEMSLSTEKGSLTLTSFDANICIIDDELEPVCDPDPKVSDIESFLGFGCGDREEPITKKQQREYDQYVRETERQIDKTKKSYASYDKTYQAWRAKVDNAIQGSAIVLTVRANEDRKASFLGVYSFTWQVASWCGEDANGSRQGVELSKVVLPAMRAGEVLELWVDGVELDHAWGGVLFDTDDQMNQYIQAISEAQSPWQKIPEDYAPIAVESGRGVSQCNVEQQCCPC